MTRTSSAVHDVPILGRARGGVRVYRPATGKASFRVVWTDTEGRQRESTRTTLDDARALAQDVATKLALEVPAQPPAPSKVTFGDVLVHCLDGPGARPGWAAATLSRYRDAARRALAPEDLDVPMHTILTDPDQTILRRILDRAVDRGCTPGGSELYQVGTMLSVVLACAAETGLIELPATGNPARALDYRRTTPGSSARAREGMTIAQVSQGDRPPVDHVSALIAAADHHLGTDAGTSLGTMSYAGVRLGELLAIRAEQVLDPDVLRSGGLLVDRQLVEYRRRSGPGGTSIGFTSPKWGSRRITWVGPPVRDRLVELARAADARGGPNALLFHAPQGDPARRSNFRRRIFGVAATHAGWPRGTENKRGRVEHPWVWTPHSLRHFYAAWCLTDLSLPIISVAHWLGHDDVRTTAAMYVRAELAELDAATTHYNERHLG